MSILDKIKSFFEKAGEDIKKAFVSIFGDKAGAELATAAESWAKTELGQIAITVVTGLQSAAGSSADKQAAAFKEIGSQLEAQGKSVPSSLINFAIEFALQIVKGSAA